MLASSGTTSTTGAAGAAVVTGGAGWAALAATRAISSLFLNSSRRTGAILFGLAAKTSLSLTSIVGADVLALPIASSASFVTTFSLLSTTIMASTAFVISKSGSFADKAVITRPITTLTLLLNSTTASFNLSTSNAVFSFSARKTTSTASLAASFALASALLILSASLNSGSSTPSSPVWLTSGFGETKLSNALLARCTRLPKKPGLVVVGGSGVLAATGCRFSGRGAPVAASLAMSQKSLFLAALTRLEASGTPAGPPVGALGA